PIRQVNAHVQREQGAQVILDNVLTVGQGINDLESEGRHFDSLAGGSLYKYDSINASERMQDLIRTFSWTLEALSDEPSSFSTHRSSSESMLLHPRSGTCTRQR